MNLNYSGQTHQEACKLTYKSYEFSFFMRLEDKKVSELGLTEEEYAFHSVLSQNDSTKMLAD